MKNITLENKERHVKLNIAYEEKNNFTLTTIFDDHPICDRYSSSFEEYYSIVVTQLYICEDDEEILKDAIRFYYECTGNIILKFYANEDNKHNIIIDFKKNNSEFNLFSDDQKYSPSHYDLRFVYEIFIEDEKIIKAFVYNGKIRKSVELTFEMNLFVFVYKSLFEDLSAKEDIAYREPDKYNKEGYWYNTITGKRLE